MLGILALLLLIGGFGSWALTAEISGAIVTSGRIAVDRNRQVVQHPDGGVVTEILVRDGDTVEAGQVLIRLDPTALQSDADILRSQILVLEGRAARLMAERDGAQLLTFPAGLLAAGRVRRDVAETIAGQRNLFATRSTARSREVEQLTRRKEQIANQISGVAAQSAALRRQLVLLRQELVAQQTLLASGLTQSSRVLALQRDEAGLLGQLGEFSASVAELQGRMTEIDLEILKQGNRTREDAITELRDLRSRQMEIAERDRAVRARMSRLDITAPVAGIVHDMQVFAQRSVIRAADPVLYLVPQDRPLVIITQVDPIHVDQVYPGQPVTLRLPAFDARITPELFGHIRRVSPDALTDPATGLTYYLAEVQPDAGEIARLDGQVLLPGMPVEAYLRTGDRRVLAYLVKPMTDYFKRAFRE
jgi:HlyD family secretion protein